MFSDPERLEAALLNGTGQPRHVHRVFGREDRDPEVHVLPLGCYDGDETMRILIYFGERIVEDVVPGGRRHCGLTSRRSHESQRLVRPRVPGRATSYNLWRSVAS